MSEPMDRRRFDDLKDAYALDALPEDETHAFELYLADNPELHGEVEEIIQISSLMALSPPEQEPSRQLRRKLMETVRSEARQGREAAGSESVLQRLRSIFVARPFALGVASLLLAALVLWNVALQRQVMNLDDENSTLTAQSEQTPGRNLSDGQVFTMTGKGEMRSVKAEVVKMENGKSVLVAEGMPQVAEEQTFQIWKISGSDVRPAGTFEANDTPVAAVLESSVEGADMVAVTVEPNGGSPQPTSEPQLTAKV